MKRVSLKDIARSVGVAPSTVSLVLNGKAKEMRISKALADRIIKISEKLGYQPNQLAVSLRTGQSKILGLITESISGHFFGSLAKVIEEEAESYGYKVVYCSTENDSRKGHELLGMLSQRQVDGYLITPTPGLEKDVLDLVMHNRPVVLLDSYFPGVDVPCVLVDNYGGVKEGMEQLIRKGYSRIGFVTVDLDLVQVSHRGKAYVETLRENGVAHDDDLILTLSYKSAKEQSISSISSFISKAKGLEAIFFSTNYLGILGLESIKQLGLRIPDDIAIICFDDHDIFRIYPPGISVMSQPVENIARLAVEMLMSQLGKNKGQVTPTQVKLPATFIPRGSF